MGCHHESERDHCHPLSGPQEKSPPKHGRNTLGSSAHPPSRGDPYDTECNERRYDSGHSALCAGKSQHRHGHVSKEPREESKYYRHGDLHFQHLALGNWYAVPCMFAAAASPFSSTLIMVVLPWN